MLWRILVNLIKKTFQEYLLDSSLSIISSEIRNLNCKRFIHILNNFFNLRFSRQISSSRISLYFLKTKQDVCQRVNSKNKRSMRVFVFFSFLHSSHFDFCLNRRARNVWFMLLFVRSKYLCNLIAFCEI
jgi:hypothetical protein